MKKEDYCSYELSKKMSDKGFDWPCNSAYKVHKISERVYFQNMGRLFDWNKSTESDRYDICSAPTLSQAQKWIRNEKDIDIDIRSHHIGGTKYDYLIFDSNGQGQIFSNGFYDTYEQALLDALTKALELI